MPFDFDVPRARVPYNVLENQLFDNLALAGDLLWVVTWALVIWIGFRDKTYGVPLIAICLNFTWEFVFTVVHPPKTSSGDLETVDFVVQLVWLVLDCIIVYQLFRFGRRFQPRPEYRRHFNKMVLIGMTAALCVHLSYGASVSFDPQGTLPALIINLVMSLLFIEFFYQRHSVGISFWVAVTKMAGTFFVGLAAVSRFWPNVGPVAFALVMFAAIAAFDLIYIVLVARAPQEATA